MSHEASGRRADRRDPAASQLHRQVVRKDYQSRDLGVNPLVHLHYVELVEPSESGTRSRAGGDRFSICCEHSRSSGELEEALACAPHLLPQIPPEIV